jgi:ABC-type multidrug transport system ATPase subunit
MMMMMMMINIFNKHANVTIILFTHNLSELRQVSIFLDHLQGVTEYQKSPY